jgi:hypothetical protein
MLFQWTSPPGSGRRPQGARHWNYSPEARGAFGNELAEETWQEEENESNSRMMEEEKEHLEPKRPRATSSPQLHSSSFNPLIQPLIEKFPKPKFLAFSLSSPRLLHFRTRVSATI